jgi:outer membrane lipoprotein-sorting protein
MRSSRRLRHALRSIATCVGATIAACSSADEARAQNPGLDVLHDAAGRYESVETLCADFTQHLLVPLLGTERSGSGRLCQGRPNLFGMRFDDPAGDLIVVDGEHAWVYFPSNDAKTALKTSADRSAGGRDFHREFLVDPGTKYEVEYQGLEPLDGRRAHRIRMLPRLASSYRAATLWIDEEAPVLRRIRLEEENGNVRTITLANVGFGEVPESGWFAFTPPEGVLVMER